MNYPEALEFETTLSAVCMRAFLEDPDRELLQFKTKDNIETWTTGDIMRRALYYAKQLISVGASPGEPVAVMLDNHPDHVAVMIALSMSGAIWLPLDRRFTAANIRRVLSQVDASVSIVESRYADRLVEGGFDGQLIRCHEATPPTHPAKQIILRLSYLT